MKINFYKREKSFQKKNPISNINLYWKIIVLTTFVVIFVFFFFSYSLFNETNKEFVVSKDNNDRLSNLVTRERIHKTLEYFSLREQKSNQILYSSSPVVDPSL